MISVWLNAQQSAARRPALRPRLRFEVAGEPVGTVEDQVLASVDPGPLRALGFDLVRDGQGAEPVWSLRASPSQVSDALNALAHLLRAAGCCGPWRNEQLSVLGAQGRHLGTVERGAVRVLGLRTQAVHLVGFAPDGRMWVQLRAFNKPNDPGLWDTLMGGMVSAADSLEQALARETWEEAGLQLNQLQDLRHGGQVDFCRPSHEAGGRGYMIERIDWFACTVPEGLEPCNQDGEVERFESLSLPELRSRLLDQKFTLEAGLIAAASLGWGTHAA